MIKTFSFESPRGSEMPLLHSQYFNLIDIEGMTLAAAELGTTTVPFVDGDLVNNIQAMPRTITLYLKLKETAGIETAKRYILRFVKFKMACKLHLEQDGRDIVIEGRVEGIELPRMSDEGSVMVITMHCSQPYWSDVDYVVAELSELINLHYFPVEEGGLAFPVDGVPFGVYDDDLTQELDNGGDVETGVIITIIATGTVINPKIYNTETGQYIGINDTLTGGDYVTISTIKGQKTITKNGENVIDKIMSGSTFLQLAAGENYFTIEAQSGVDSVYFTIQFKQLYV